MNTMNTYVTPVIFSEALLRDANQETDVSAQTQTRDKTMIDAVICQNLDGDKLKEALFIIDNIRENNMKIKWSSVNVWSVRYKRKHVCDLRVANGSMRIGPVNDILATRVKNMTHDFESLKQLIDTLKSSISDPQEAGFALQ